MANWCDTRITFICEERYVDRLEDLYNRLLSLHEAKEQGLWLYDIAKDYNFTPTAKEYSAEVNYIEEFSSKEELIKNREFSIETYDAWCPKLGFWYELLHRFYPRIEDREQDRQNTMFLSNETCIDVVYTASECGDCLFWTNNMDQTSKYNLYISADSRYDQDKEMMECFPKHTEVDICAEEESMWEILKRLQEYNPNITSYEKIPYPVKSMITQYKYKSFVEAAMVTLVPTAFDLCSEFAKPPTPFDIEQEEKEAKAVKGLVVNPLFKFIEEENKDK